jgi:hypothetical protein
MPPPILPSKNFLEIVDELNVNIEFVSAREAIDTSGPMGRVFLTMVGSIAELERSLIVERMKDRMRRAKWGAAVRACTARRVSRATVVRLVREANQREIIVAA